MEDLQVIDWESNKSRTETGLSPVIAIYGLKWPLLAPTVIIDVLTIYYPVSMYLLSCYEAEYA